MPLTRLNTRTIEREGGTILQSTRTNPARMRVGDLPPHLAAYGAGHGPDDRVDLTAEVLGQSGLSGPGRAGGHRRRRYAQLWRGAVGATACRSGASPRRWTMTCPAPTTASASRRPSAAPPSSSTACRSTVGSHRETVLFRMFGRDAGFTALETAIVTWADRLLIPEVPADVDRLAELVARIGAIRRTTRWW